MASVVFSEAILIIASVIIAAALAGVIMNKAGMFSSTFTVSSETQKNILLTKIKVIYATNSSSTVNAWIKNIGSYPVTSPQSVDVYFGPLGSVQRIPYGSGSTTWTYNSPVLVWNSTNTVQINIVNSAPLQKNTVYQLQVTTPNGVSDDYFMST